MWANSEAVTSGSMWVFLNTDILYQDGVNVALESLPWRVYTAMHGENFERMVLEPKYCLICYNKPISEISKHHNSSGSNHTVIPRQNMLKDIFSLGDEKKVIIFKTWHWS